MPTIDTNDVLSGTVISFTRFNNPAYDYDDTQHPVGTSISLLKIWLRTPGFRTLRGIKPNNAFYFHRVFNSAWSGSTKEYRVPQYPNNAAVIVNSQITSGIGMDRKIDVEAQLGLTFGTAEIGELTDKVNSSILSQLKNSSNIIVDSVQYAQAKSMFIGNASKIVESLRCLRKGDILGLTSSLGITPSKRQTKRFNKRHKDYLKYGGSKPGSPTFGAQSKLLAANYLEFQYGWKPLLQDVHGAAEIFASSVYPPSRLEVKSHKTLSRTISYSTTNPSGWLETWTADGNEVLTVKSAIRYAVSQPTLNQWKSLGITNPAAIAWELVPFSFVLDWLLPIGNYLESFDATNGLAFQSGYLTVFQKVEGVGRAYLPVQMKPGEGGSYPFYIEMDTSVNMSTVHVERSTLLEFPSAALHFKNPLSLVHSLNAIALAISLINK